MISKKFTLYSLDIIWLILSYKGTILKYIETTLCCADFIPKAKYFMQGGFVGFALKIKIGMLKLIDRPSLIILDWILIIVIRAPSNILYVI